MAFTVKLLNKEKVTHDVFQLVLEKPKGYTFTAGQCADLTVQREGYAPEKAPFSFIGLNTDGDLRVAMKTYRGEETLSGHAHRLQNGDAVTISEARNEVEYHGPGVFIAGGTGITPFMAIFRQLQKDGKLKGNMLLYANKRGEDICFEGELHNMFGTQVISILSLEDRPRNASGEIDKGFIELHVRNFNQPFYLCGPEPFVKHVALVLKELGVKKELVSEYY